MVTSHWRAGRSLSLSSMATAKGNGEASRVSLGGLYFLCLPARGRPRARYELLEAHPGAERGDPAEATRYGGRARGTRPGHRQPVHRGEVRAYIRSRGDLRNSLPPERRRNTPKIGLCGGGGGGRACGFNPWSDSPTWRPADEEPAAQKRHPATISLQFQRVIMDRPGCRFYVVPGYYGISDCIHQVIIVITG